MQVNGMHKAISLAFALGIAGLSTSAGAESQPEDVIKYRQNVMKAIGGHMSAAGAIVQGKVEYKANLSEHAKALAAMTKDIVGLFPKDSDFGDTNALESVWKKRADFEKVAKDAGAKAAALAKAAAGNDPKAAGAAFKDLADACKACHKDYRKEQK
jgi:cytochrome c556